MATLKTNEAARGYLFHTLEAISIPWWYNFSGSDIERSSGNSKPIRRPLYQQREGFEKRTVEQLRCGKTPTRWRFLATWLTYERRKLPDSVLRHLMRADVGNTPMGNDPCWSSDDPLLPDGDDSLDAWRLWPKHSRGILWLTEEKLQLALSPAQQAFRQAVLGVEVVEVAQNGIMWRIPGVDLGQSEENLRQQFTESLVGDPEATGGSNRNGNQSVSASGVRTKQVEGETPAAAREEGEDRSVIAGVGTPKDRPQSAQQPFVETREQAPVAKAQTPQTEKQQTNGNSQLRPGRSLSNFHRYDSASTSPSSEESSAGRTKGNHGHHSRHPPEGSWDREPDSRRRAQTCRDMGEAEAAQGAGGGGDKMEARGPLPEG